MIDGQKRKIEDLESMVNRLAKSRHKMDRKLSEKSDVLQLTEKQKKEALLKTTKDYEQMEKELRITKEALDDAQNREKQVSPSTYIVNAIYTQILFVIIYDSMLLKVKEAYVKW